MGELHQKHPINRDGIPKPTPKYTKHAIISNKTPNFLKLGIYLLILGFVVCFTLPKVIYYMSLVVDVVVGLW